MAKKSKLPEAAQEPKEAPLLFKVRIRDNASVKVRINDFDGTPSLDIRQWVKTKDGWVRTSKGVRIPLDKLQEFQIGIKKVSK